ncbi:MAG: penicillin-binding transpeptidase domain-containing protein, partial [Actinomycetes bacterium]
KKAVYTERKDAYCKRAVDGYPEVTPEDRAKLLQSYAKDFCESGDQFRAGDALNFAIGQGDTGVTPLQVAALYSAIGNGGTLWRPQLVRAVVGKDGSVSQKIDPSSYGKLDAPAGALGYLQTALADTSVSGTMAGVFPGFPLNKISVAAKTGTAEVAGKASTAWVASFAPATSAKYTVVCVVSQGGTGSGTCGPSVRRIYEALFGITGSTVDPSKSVLKGGEPSDSIPKVTSDGVGVAAVSAAPPAKAAPKATKGPSPTASASPAASPTKAAPPAGESTAAAVSPAPTPTGDRPAGEAPVGIVPTPGTRSLRSRSPCLDDSKEKRQLRAPRRCPTRSSSPADLRPATEAPNCTSAPEPTSVACSDSI